MVALLIEILQMLQGNCFLASSTAIILRYKYKQIFIVLPISLHTRLLQSLLS